MKILSIETVSDKVIMFMHKDNWDEKTLAKRIEMTPQTLSRRIYFNNWTFDEVAEIKALFKSRNYKF